jgi:ABC-type antimicrobial peptide transport system permease subunit
VPDSVNEITVIGCNNSSRGIRMALGAHAGEVLRLVVTDGMRMAVIGIALTRVFASFLLGVGTADPLTFTGVAVLLATVALVACYIPARRAACVDPLVALRHTGTRRARDAAWNPTAPRVS